MVRPEPFREAASRAERISLGGLLRLHGRATWPAVLLVTAVLCTLPVTGIGTALSLPLLALARHWPRVAALPLDRSRWGLSPRLVEARLSEDWSRRCLRLLAAVYDWARRALRRRWVGWRHPRTFLWWRAWIAAMALLILLPLPLGNLLPGISLVALSLGWIYKDGVALFVSLLCGSAGLVYGALTVHVAWAVVEAAVRAL